MARSEDIKTPLARFSFTRHLFKPKENENGKLSYNTTLLFPKGEIIGTDGNGKQKSLQDLAAEVAVAQWGEKAKQMIANGLIKSPFLDGDGPQALNKKTGERHAGYAGHTFIRVSSGSDFPPKVFAKDAVNRITSEQELYSGCYGYAVVNAYTWENDKNGKGISFGVSLVQFAKDGEKLGGGGGPDEGKFLSTIADEGEAPAATKSGKGASGLFS